MTTQGVPIGVEQRTWLRPPYKEGPGRANGVGDNRVGVGQ